MTGSARCRWNYCRGAETPAPAARDARPARDAHAGTRWRQKRVRHQLDGADLTLFIPAGDAQIALLQLRRKRAAHAVPAVVALFNALPAIGAGNQRIRPQLDDGRGLHQRAAEGRSPSALRCRFPHVRRPASRARCGRIQSPRAESRRRCRGKECCFPGIADRGKRAFRVTIRAAGNDPDGIVLRQRLAGGDRRVASQSYFTGCSSTAAASSIAGEWPDGQQYRGDNRRQGRGVKGFS